MARPGRTQLLKLGGFSVALVLVLAGLPFLERNGYISGSTALAVFGGLTVVAGVWKVRSPEQHDIVLGNEEDHAESKVRWRRFDERLGGVATVGVGLVFIFLGLT